MFPLWQWHWRVCRENASQGWRGQFGSLAAWRLLEKKVCKEHPRLWGKRLWIWSLIPGSTCVNLSAETPKVASRAFMRGQCEAEAPLCHRLVLWHWTSDFFLQNHSVLIYRTEIPGSPLKGSGKDEISQWTLKISTVFFALGGAILSWQWDWRE